MNAPTITQSEAHARTVGTVSGPICKACAQRIGVKPFEVEAASFWLCRGCGRVAVGFATVATQWGETMHDAIGRLSLNEAGKVGI